MSLFSLENVFKILHLVLKSCDMHFLYHNFCTVKTGVRFILQFHNCYIRSFITFVFLLNSTKEKCKIIIISIATSCKKNSCFRSVFSMHVYKCFTWWRLLDFTLTKYNDHCDCHNYYNTSKHTSQNQQQRKAFCK